MESGSPFDKAEEIKRYVDEVAKEIVCKNGKLLEMQRNLEEKERMLQEHIQGAEEMQKFEVQNVKLKHALASERIEAENKILMQEIELENIKKENEELKRELSESRIHFDEKLAESKTLVSDLAEEVVNKNRKIWQMERILGKGERMLEKPIKGTEEETPIEIGTKSLQYTLARKNKRLKLELQSIKDDNEELKTELVSMKQNNCWLSVLLFLNRTLQVTFESPNFIDLRRMLEYFAQIKNRFAFEEKLLESKVVADDLLKELANKNEKLLEMERKLEENERKLQEHIQGEEEMQRVKEESKKRKQDLASREVEEISQDPNGTDGSMTDLVNDLREMLAEKDEELHDMEALNQTLILRERMNNNELQDARKELINVLPDILDSNSIIGLKRMGEVAQKPFQDACLERFPIRSWGLKSASLSSLWQDKVNNPTWQPFKHVTRDGRLQEAIDEDDRQLKELRNAWGEEAYNTVVNALLELNEHNPSGRYIVSELWNFETGRKATLKEVIQCLIQQLVACKSAKRRRISLRHHN